MVIGIIKSLVNRKTLIIVFIGLFVTGVVLTIIGTVTPDENIPIRIEFQTYSQYTNELNSFFNRTDVTPLEDAQNKLIEDYVVRGYIILPKTPKPSEGYPVVIWMHGFSASAELQINYPRLFAKSGFIAVAISQPGHGCSGGYWDMGIQALLGVYSTVEWLVNDSIYKDLIDKNRIGVAGHSMGGIVTTRAGIFDNWTNPKTGLKVGTGGAIRSYCAIYCWDDLYSMAESLMYETLGIRDIWNHPTILKILGQWRWLSNHDPSILQEEVRLRSVSNFITAENIPNYCLITGSEDELTTIEAQCHIMANATINATGIPEVSWTTIYTQVTTTSNHTWEYGDMAKGNARRLIIVPGIGHLQEAFDYRVMSNVVYWFNESMNCTNINTDIPTNLNVPFLTKMVGWFLALVSMLGCILPTVSYLSTSKLRTTSPIPTIAPNLHKNQRLRMVYLLIPIVSISCGALVTLPSMTHFWIFDLIIPVFLIMGLILLPFVLYLTYKEKRHYGYKLEDFGLSKSLIDNLKAIAIPVCALAGCIAVFDLVCWFLQVPFLLPRPLDLPIILDFILLFGILLLQNFCFELLFRGLYQTKIEKYGARKYERWKTVFKSGMFSGISIGIGFAINILIIFGSLFINSPLIIVGLFGGLIFMYFMIGVVAAYIYQRTRNILSSTFFLALLMALFISGKLLLTYA
ncbi:MAG: alpha/beta fold hydrolase [Candidatus Helarchaeota archaeon]